MLVKSFGGFLVHASIVSELIMTALRIQVTNIFRPLVSVLLSVLYSNRNSGNSKPKGICVKKNGSLPIIDHTYTKFFPRPVPHIFTYSKLPNKRACSFINFRKFCPCLGLRVLLYRDTTVSKAN